jgi:hypothetical protein
MGMGDKNVSHVQIRVLNPANDTITIPTGINHGSSPGLFAANDVTVCLIHPDRNRVKNHRYLLIRGS